MPRWRANRDGTIRPLGAPPPRPPVPDWQQALYTPAYQALRTRLIADHPWCEVCGHEGTDDNPLEIDHIVPLSRGGHPTDEGNCRVLCRRHNRQKGART